MKENRPQPGMFQAQGPGWARDGMKGAGRARLLPVKPMLGSCRAGVPGWEEAAPHPPDGVVWEGGRTTVRGRG